jgi:hypothetical protein
LVSWLLFLYWNFRNFNFSSKSRSKNDSAERGINLFENFELIAKGEDQKQLALQMVQLNRQMV